MRMTVPCDYQAVVHQRGRCNNQWQSGTLQWLEGRVLLLSSTGGVLSESIPQAAMSLHRGEIVKTPTHTVRGLLDPSASKKKQCSEDFASKASASKQAVVKRPSSTSPSLVVYDCRFMTADKFKSLARGKNEVWQEGYVEYDEFSRMARFYSSLSKQLIVAKQVESMNEGAMIGTDLLSRHVFELIARRITTSQSNVVAALNPPTISPGGSSELPVLTEFNVVYTRDKHKKQNRKWLDGKLEYNVSTQMARFFSIPEDVIEEEEEEEEKREESKSDDSDVDDDARQKTSKWKRPFQRKKPIKKHGPSHKREMIYSRRLSPEQVYEGAELEAGMLLIVINESANRNALPMARPIQGIAAASRLLPSTATRPISKAKAPVKKAVAQPSIGKQFIPARQLETKKNVANFAIEPQSIEAALDDLLASESLDLPPPVSLFS